RNRWSRMAGGAALAWLALSTATPLAGADTPTEPTKEFPVWEGTPPGFVPPGPRRDTWPAPGKRKVLRITDVDQPFVRWFRAPGAVAGARRTAVIVLPGGGFHVLAAEHEGDSVARWLNGLGIDAFVLCYRVPTASQQPEWEPGLADLQETLAVVRRRRLEFGIDETRVGVLGFSAGGHLAARSAFSVGTENARLPDFAVLIYPYRIVVDSNPDQLRDGLHPTEAAPPLFLVHAADDNVSIDNSLTLHHAALKAGVPTALHAFATSGHGFGLMKDTPAGAAWPALCASWMRDRGLVGDAAPTGD
ncbi:MAG: alpha/beta hydrolase, partial [Planctomycetota bacterium]